MGLTLDRIKESVIVSGTSIINLSGNGANGGFLPFNSAATNGQTFTICIIDQLTFAWELCQSTYVTAGAPGQLTRGTVLSSSYLGNRVNFPGNTCDVFITDSSASAGTVNFNNAMSAWISSLPTSLPSLAGQPWNNGGLVCVS